MANDILVEIFDSCVTRLEQGATIDDCVRMYPNFASELRPMLEATRIPQRAQATPDEVTQSQARVAIRFEQALAQPINYRRSYPLRQVASFILLVLFISGLLTGGVVVAAQDSLPGDNLYAFKRLTEQVQLALASDTIELEARFAQRRIDETKQVIALGREVDVQFAGVIERVRDNLITVAGLDIELSDTTRTIELSAGMQVDLSARTRVNLPLLAQAIRIINLPQLDSQTEELLDFTPIAETVVPTPAQATPTREATEPIRPTSTPTADNTATALPSPSATLTATDLSTADEARSPQCRGEQSDNWVRYTVQVGDTPSAIAVATGITLDAFYSANCQLDPRILVVGEVVLVPYAPYFPATATDTQRTPITPMMTAEPIQRPIENTPQQPTATAIRDENNDSRQRNRNNNGDDDGGDNPRGR